MDTPLTSQKNAEFLSDKNISLHRIPEIELSKEIRCRDCGSIYVVPSDLISSTCETCGNISFHPEFSTSSVLKERSREKKLSEAASKLSTNPTPAAKAYHELIQSPYIAPERIEEIAIQNQAEWQLWAKVTENFSDNNRHLAYLSFITRNLLFDKASERYRTHRSRYLQIPEEAWQIEKSDNLLEKISSLCEIQFTQALKRPVLKEIKVFRRSLQLLFFFLGIAIATHIIGWVLSQIKQ